SSHISAQMPKWRSARSGPTQALTLSDAASRTQPARPQCSGQAAEEIFKFPKGWRAPTPNLTVSLIITRQPILAAPVPRLPEANTFFQELL
ncbi:hypothetical protein, partial [Nitratireductor sp. XY-223]|uniref:hypothetical protein n=1 Tax=Nitratireductor sp. XY-223 TaxID=2561926 RepID=UPI0019800BDF